MERLPCWEHQAPNTKHTQHIYIHHVCTNVFPLFSPWRNIFFLPNSETLQVSRMHSCCRLDRHTCFWVDPHFALPTLPLSVIRKPLKSVWLGSHWPASHLSASGWVHSSWLCVLTLTVLWKIMVKNAPKRRQPFPLTRKWSFFWWVTSWWMWPRQAGLILSAVLLTLKARYTITYFLIFQG